MIHHDPVVNFLNLLVGAAGGWTLGEASRAWARSDRWAPVIGGLLILAALVLMYLLLLTLGILRDMALAPGLLGAVLGALARQRQARR